MRNRPGRRTFLRTAGAAASVAFLGSWLFDDSLVIAAPYMRRDVGGLSDADPLITSYRKAIKAMKSLSVTDPRSWAYQAAIHGTMASPPQMAWNTCEHGTYFFWSWHRMYLYWFERIVRKMSGDRGWSLPYWNWTSPSERQLPAMFRDTSSELYVANRKAAINNGTGSLPAFDVNYAPAFSLVGFSSASSSLEGTPHGAVHVDIGGWMGSVPTAAQDPIFYLHHCNIDRLWNLWLAQGGGRSDPLADATWTNTKFTFFNENGGQEQMNACDILRAAQQLHYTYEGEPPQINQYCHRVVKMPPKRERAILIHLPIPPIVLKAEPVVFDFELKNLRQRLAAMAESKSETLFLELEGVEARLQPGVVWEVYLGAPAKNLKRDPRSPFYVGNLALFGNGIRSEAHGKFKPARFAFPINRAMGASLRKNEERVSITFVAHGILVDGKPSRPKVESPVHIGAVNITVERETAR